MGVPSFLEGMYAEIFCTQYFCCCFTGDLALQASHPKGIIEGHTPQTGKGGRTLGVPLGPVPERGGDLVPLSKGDLSPLKRRDLVPPSRRDLVLPSRGHVPPSQGGHVPLILEAPDVFFLKCNAQLFTLLLLLLFTV